jgi:uncharacterized RDD family membrane protein YckC
VGDGGYEIICAGCRAAVSPDAAACPHCGHTLFGRTPLQFPQRAAPLPAGGAADAAIPNVGTGWAVPARSRDPLREASVRYGGFWIRVGARLIDSLVLLLPLVLLRDRLGAMLPIVVWVGNWLYFAFMESSYNQATLGKLACGLAVTDLEGQRISFARATGRHFAQFFCGLTLGLGYAMVGWTRQKRGLHDFIAGTLVVRR